VENIYVHKGTAIHKGHVEYLLIFNNPILCGREPNVQHIESENFENLAGLLALLDVHMQTTLCRTHLADAIQIHRIVLRGEDQVQNKIEVNVDTAGIQGHFSVAVSTKEMISRSSELLIYMEYKLQSLLQQLAIENNKPKEEIG
jgi:hypothetical protein